MENFKKIIEESITVKQNLLKDESVILNIEKAINLIVTALEKGKKVLVFGNGGSAGDSQHFAGELINRFKIDRRPLPAISLVTDTSVLSSIGNDSGYDFVFSKQIEALGTQGDIAIAITTSDIEMCEHGHSANIGNALKIAKEKGLITIGLVSIKSKKILELLDVAIMVPSENTPRIQESHILIIHILCELIEKIIFKKDDK